jgi:hypothetical protein
VSSDEDTSKPPTLRDLVVEIKVRLDLALTRVDDHEARLRLLEARPVVDAADHEARLRVIERRVWVAAGAAAAAGVAGGHFIGLL